MSGTNAPQDEIIHTARRALSSWGWPDDSELALLKHRENAVFAVLAPQGRRAVLRLHRPNYHSHAALVSELQWMAALHAGGVPTSVAIPTPDGRHIVSCRAGRGEEYFVDMLDWIAGAPVGSAEKREYREAAGIEVLYRELGQLAGRMHSHSESWQAPDGFWRPSWDLAGCIGSAGTLAYQPQAKPLWGLFSDLGRLERQQRRLLEEAARRVVRELAAFGQSGDRYGLIHGDLVPDNLMETEQGLVAIDFDDCGFGWYLWEFATAVFWHIGEPTFESACRGYMDGYRKVRALPDSHLALMPAMLVMRALVYLGWMHTRRDTATARELTDHVIAVSMRLAAQLMDEQEPLAADAKTAQPGARWLSGKN